jgi:nitroreductase
VTLYETISKRKSTRKYDPAPLSAEVLGDIQKFADAAKPLRTGVNVRFDILPADKMKGPTNAPHFIAAYSENKPGSLTNIGFMLQQTELYIQSKGLGACWLGLAKPAKPSGGLDFVISLAFGKAEGDPYREPAEFKRKPLDRIAAAPDARLEPARLAPSAVNSQPWYFIKNANGFDCYCAKKFPAVVYGKLNQIDMGIALAHLYVAFPDAFAFTFDEKGKAIKGYSCVGKVELRD